MKRVYIQIIDPLNGTCVNACHEYPSEYHQAMDQELLNRLAIAERKVFNKSKNNKK